MSWFSRSLSLSLTFALGMGCAHPGADLGSAQTDAVATASPIRDFLIARQLELDGDREEAYEAYRRAVEADPESAYLLRRITELAWRLGMYDEARLYGERAHELDPDDARSRIFLAHIYQIERDIDAAEAILRDENDLPVSENAASLIFAMEMEQERYPEALATAEWLMDAAPESLRAYFFIAKAYTELGRSDEAEEAYREGLRISPGNLGLYAELAGARRDRGDREGEIAIYREVLEIYPHHQLTLRSLAEAQVRLHHVDEAIETYTELVRFYPHDQRGVLRLALLQYELERYDEAARQFEWLLELDAERHEIRFFYGLVLSKQDRMDEAIRAFEAIPEGDARYVEARTQLATIYEERGDYSAAVDELNRVSDRSASPALDLYLASMMAKDGRVEEAIAFVEALRVEAPEEPELLFNLGVLEGEAGRADRSLEVMHEVLELDPDHAGALNYIGYSWAERGIRLHEAEALIVRALEQRPNDGYITDSLGWVYYMRGMELRDGEGAQEGRELLRRSVVELEKAMQLTGGDPIITEHLGDAYLALDEKRRALESYRKALDLRRSDDDVSALHDKVERLMLELGEQ